METVSFDSFSSWAVGLAVSGANISDQVPPGTQ